MRHDNGVALTVALGGALVAGAFLGRRSPQRTGSRATFPAEPLAPAFITYTIDNSAEEALARYYITQNHDGSYLYQEYQVVESIVSDDHEEGKTESRIIALVVQPVAFVTGQVYSTDLVRTLSTVMPSDCIYRAKADWIDLYVPQNVHNIPRHFMAGIAVPAPATAPDWSPPVLLDWEVNEEAFRALDCLTEGAIDGPRESVLMQVYVFEVLHALDLSRPTRAGLPILLQHADQLRREGAFKRRVVLGGRQVWHLGSAPLSPQQARAAGLTPADQRRLR